ncbi:MAG: SDR family oxidoreductase [Chloroflexi bacterium]|nr:SDR family oxidoreductase [Chloroflexota bacterium]
MLDTGLQGKVALVTGANQGIGAATALALARQGARVFVHYFRPPAINAAAGVVRGPDVPGVGQYNASRGQDASAVLAALRALGVEAEAWECDLSDPDNAALLFDRAEAAFGQVDVLVNNAADWQGDTFIPQGQPQANTLPERWSEQVTISAHSHDRHFAVNSRAVALLMAKFLRRHIVRGGSWGRIINISTDGAYCFPGEVSYGASKAALEAWSRSAAAEMAQFGITVNIVSPGPIQTGWITPELEPEIVATIPLGRLGLPEDVADVIVFMASEQARWVTGQIVHVGGGHVM